MAADPSCVKQTVNNKNILCYQWKQSVHFVQAALLLVLFGEFTGLMTSQQMNNIKTIRNHYNNIGYLSSAKKHLKQLRICAIIKEHKL